MLVLERKRGAGIILRQNGQIIARVTVQAIRPSGKVLVGVEAGPELEINRDELDIQRHPEVHPGRELVERIVGVKG